MISEIPSQCPIDIIISCTSESQWGQVLSPVFFFGNPYIFPFNSPIFFIYLSSAELHSVVTFLKKNIGYINVSAILWISYKQLTYNKIIANLNV